MAAVRCLVQEVDESPPFYRVIGFKLADRWGPPFAVMKGSGLSLRLSGPGTSARKWTTSRQLPEPGSGHRRFTPVKSMAEAVAKLQQDGVSFRSRPLKGPGGQPALIEDTSGSGVEMFQPRHAK